MKTSLLFILVAFTAHLAGCTTVVPNELVKARSAYQVASEGPAQRLAPAELHKAHEALNVAEESFKNDSDSSKTKDLAYVAQRKSEQAEVLGSIAVAKAIKDRANADFETKQTQIVEQGKKDLILSEQQTAAAHAELANQAAVNAANEKNNAEKQAAEKQAELNKQAAVKATETQANLDRQAALKAAETQAELDKQMALKTAEDKANAELEKQQAAILQGQQELKDSEKRTADARAELAAIASVKEEERGLVVTLSGSILFRSAESTLLPPAMAKLDQVAKALLSINARNLIVEGYTDSQGSKSYNQGLSQRRADAVRDYLVQRGYPANHIQSRGRGESSPIANNSSAEGRANNRRVEIVIEREPLTPKQ